MQAELAGATGGLVATAPMTAAMALMHRLLPEQERYPLPPRQIVDNAVRQTGSEDLAPGEAHDLTDRRTGLEPREGDRDALTLASHFAFGLLAGTAYGPIARAKPSHPALAGIGYGLMVWTSQYMGVLPAAGLLSNARYHPARRNALMIAAHVVWGAALGLVADRLVRTSG